MMAPRLSSETQHRVDLLFGPADRAEAACLLIEQCGNSLPFLEDLDEYDLERVRFAALKVSRGNLQNLRSAISLAKRDWRDLLMSAGFGGDIHAHRRWVPLTPEQEITALVAESAAERAAENADRSCCVILLLVVALISVGLAWLIVRMLPVLLGVSF